MENSNKFIKFSEALFSAADAAGEKMTAKRAEAIFKLVKNNPLEILLAAIENHYLNSEFPIKPANIAKFIENNKKISSPRPEEIFKKVVRAIQSNSYDDINFNCPRIHHCIQGLGGLKRICNSQETELIWIEKEFCDIYEASKKLNLSWDKIPRYLSSPYKNCNKKQVNINLNKPVERKALPGPVEEKRIDFSNSREFQKFQEQLRSMFK